MKTCLALLLLTMGCTRVVVEKETPLLLPNCTAGTGGTDTGGAGGTDVAGAGGTDTGGVGGAAGTAGAAGAGGTDMGGAAGMMMAMAGVGGTDSDPANCGAVGYACTNGRTCSSGRCSPAWQSISTLAAPSPRGYAAAASLDGKYVVFGGCTTTNTNAQPTGTVGIYDPATNTWSAGPSMVTPRAQHSGVFGNGKIYAFGGIYLCYNGGAVGAGFEGLDSLAGSWSMDAGANVPGVYNTAILWTGSKFFAYGGSTWFTPAYGFGWSLTPGGDWEEMEPPLEDPRRGGAYSIHMKDGMLRIWGGGPWGDAPMGITFDMNETWSSWEPPAGTPDFQNYLSSNRYADDGRRIYYIRADGNVMIYDRQTDGWTEDDASASIPAGYCSEGAVAWTGSELIQWSGRCGWNLSTVGLRYQPPAPSP